MQVAPPPAHIFFPRRSRSRFAPEHKVGPLTDVRDLVRKRFEKWALWKNQPVADKSAPAEPQLRNAVCCRST